VISSKPIYYPFCDRDADILLILDKNGAQRASECVCHKTVCVVDTHTISKPEAFIANGRLLRCPFSKQADEHNIAAVVNLVALGWLAEFLHQRPSAMGLPMLADDHYCGVIQRMPKRIRGSNQQAFELGTQLYQKASRAFA
jgi:Pyruvate/2-oxoacid:ferredoxin oxidoreductase gamma subunit